MCGIVGLFCKSDAVADHLGEHLSRMLVQMNDRGPDSAGVAVYRDPAPAGSCKLTLQHADPAFDFAARSPRASPTRSAASPTSRGAPRTPCWSWPPTPPTRRRGCASSHPDVRVMSAGSVIEIYKETGLPSAFAERFGLGDIRGSHALGHTRMATESRVTTLGSHPFSTGLDVCLVHNGSLSNHNDLRRKLRREGIEFHTENDTEVAAGYLTWRLREGDSLHDALMHCLDDLDGFYTFAIGTADGFAVFRDPIACKPAVMAETDDWVAMASEFRAIAVLPGAENARIWEPAPATPYIWEGVRV